MRVAWDIERLRQLVSAELANGRFESLRELALRAGVAPRELYGVLERSLVMTPELARGMAFFFGVDLSELVVIDGDDEQKNESGLSS
jgi:lambda repressor-like predicted transcriptional regulator